MNYNSSRSYLLFHSGDNQNLAFLNNLLRFDIDHCKPFQSVSGSIFNRVSEEKVGSSINVIFCITNSNLHRSHVVLAYGLPRRRFQNFMVCVDGWSTYAFKSNCRSHSPHSISLPYVIFYATTQADRQL